MFGFNKMTLLKNEKGKDNYINEVTRTLNKLSKGKYIFIADSDMGPGCDSLFTNAVINAAQRGVKIEIVFGPYVLIDIIGNNELINYILNVNPENITLHFIKDLKHMTNFHFAIVNGWDCINEYPHNLYEGDKEHCGFKVSKSTDLIRRNDVIWEELKKNSFPKIKIVDIFWRTREELKEITNTKEYKETETDFIALIVPGIVLNEDIEGKYKSVMKDF